MISLAQKALISVRPSRLEDVMKRLFGAAGLMQVLPSNHKLSCVYRTIH